MTPNDLVQVGERLYGSQWKSELARNLGVSRNTVSRWATGDKEIPTLQGLAIEALKQRKVEELSR